MCVCLFVGERQDHVMVKQCACLVVKKMPFKVGLVNMANKSDHNIFSHVDRYQFLSQLGLGEPQIKITFSFIG